MSAGRAVVEDPRTVVGPAADTDRWLVHGGPLRAELPVPVGGFKHLLVPALAASCMADAPWRFSNVPDIADRDVLSGIISALGARVDQDVPGGRLTVDASSLTGHVVPSGASDGVHGGVYLLPALLAARGRVSSGTHGGCRIGSGPGGARPVGHVAAVLEAFGASCQVRPDGFQATAPAGGLRGTVIDLADYADVEPVTGTLTGPHYSGATKTALLAAATATGTTVLRNPYPKLDTTGLAQVLRSAGVAVDLTPTEIVVEGAAGPLGAAEVAVPSDLMEVVTFIALAVHLRGELELALDGAGQVRDGLAPELRYLDQMGVPLRWGPRALHVGVPDRLRPADVTAASHFAYSDAQPLFALMLLGADGPSRLVDLVWQQRFGYVPGLARMGARLRQHGNELQVSPSVLHATDTVLTATDLRAASTLVIAALGTGRPHQVAGVDHLRRGHQGFAEKLIRLGARIEAAPSAAQPA